MGVSGKLLRYSLAPEFALEKLEGNYWYEVEELCC